MQPVSQLPYTQQWHFRYRKRDSVGAATRGASLRENRREERKLHGGGKRGRNRWNKKRLERGEGTRGKKETGRIGRATRAEAVSHDGGVQTGDEIKAKEKAHNVAASSQLLRLNGFPREGNYYAVKASGRPCDDDGKNCTTRGDEKLSVDTRLRGRVQRGKEENRKRKKEEGSGKRIVGWKVKKG